MGSRTYSLTLLATNSPRAPLTRTFKVMVRDIITLLLSSREGILWTTQAVECKYGEHGTKPPCPLAVIRGAGITRTPDGLLYIQMGNQSPSVLRASPASSSFSS